jgi:hypothetical protein
VAMVNVQLGKLACHGLEGYFEGDLSAGTRQALVHYAYKLRVGRPPVAPPRFPVDPSPARARFDLTLDRETEAALAEEALRHEVTVSQLAAHAVLVYLAELEFLGVVPRGTPTAPRNGEGAR